MLILVAQFPETSPWLWPVLQWLGIGSLAGLVGLWATLISFQPDLDVESVVDVSKIFNAESRLRFKNLGKLPACNVRPDVHAINLAFAGCVMQDCGVYSGPDLFPRIAGGQSVETPIPIGMSFPPTTQFRSFSYELTLSYDTRLIFFSKSFQKSWRIELRPRPDGYSWLVKHLPIKA